MTDPQLAYLIGIDLGGTNIHAGIVNINGEVLSRKLVPTLVNEGRDRIVERIVAVIQELKGQSPHGSIQGIGIGAAGIIDIERGTIVTSPNFPGWHDVPLRDIISRRFDIPTILDNDANAAVFGEHWAGAGQDCSIMIGLTLGTGVGGGIILDGRLWHGSEGMAGEIGHMTIVPDGLQCPCGNRGCLEAYVSATGIVRRTIERLDDRTAQRLFKAVGINEPGELTAALVHRAALGGNDTARDILRETGVYLGIAIGSLINILNPELFIIGGGASNAWDFFYPSMVEETKQRSLAGLAERVRIVRAHLGDDAGMIGACGLAARSLNL
ncbi:MAG: ROK family protein [bacterium]